LLLIGFLGIFLASAGLLLAVCGLTLLPPAASPVFLVTDDGRLLSSLGFFYLTSTLEALLFFCRGTLLAGEPSAGDHYGLILAIFLLISCIVPSFALAANFVSASELDATPSFEVSTAGIFV
jgi:hypothetical protein